MKNKIKITIAGQGIAAEFFAVSHEIMGLPAGTYHKFELEGGATLLYNDFGIRQLRIEKLPA